MLSSSLGLSRDRHLRHSSVRHWRRAFDHHRTRERAHRQLLRTASGLTTAALPRGIGSAGVHPRRALSPERISPCGTARAGYSVGCSRCVAGCERRSDGISTELRVVLLFNYWGATRYAARFGENGDRDRSPMAADRARRRGKSRGSACGWHGRASHEAHRPGGDALQAFISPTPWLTTISDCRSRAGGERAPAARGQTKRDVDQPVSQQLGLSDSLRRMSSDGGLSRGR